MFIRSFASHSALFGSASLIAILISAQSSMANPIGGTVETGAATIETPSPNTVLITQQTDKAIINWDNFDIGVNETTRFVLPSRNSVTLNRDYSGDPSEILGTLQSNGRFYLVNRSGILFGRNARVDVGGLVATTHDIRSDDFMAGRLNFDIPGDPGASVINRGSISIQDFGIGAFVAPHVRNDGAIVANMGKVSLASANGFTLDLHGDRLISFLIENPNDHQIYDANGNPISAFVENMGTIVADGGQVVLTASAARGVVDSVINTDGVIQANTVSQGGGKIILGGGTTGRVRTSGRIIARGNDAGEKGGEITIAGEKVLADAFAVFDATGRAGGGKFMLGGDYRGGKATNDEVADLGIEMEEEPIQTAKLVVLEEGVQIDVSAIDEGDGGKLIVWSDDATFTAADLSARGGSISGNGGFIETSGKYLQVEKAADASAANGEAGTWLLDPLNITINHAIAANGDWGFNPSEVWSIYGGGSFTAQTIYPTDTGSVVAVELLESGINNGSNVVVTTYGTAGSEDGDIRLRADIDKTSGGDARLSLIAAGDIRIDRGVEVRSTSGELTFELSAAEGRIDATNVGRMDLNGGELILVAKDGIDFTSRRDMPDYLTIGLNNTDLGSSRRNVNIVFDDDIVNFSYSAEVADFRPGAITLLDRSSDGDVWIGFRTAVDGRLYDRAITGHSHRGWEVANFNSFGAIDSNALNGIPEVEGYSDTFFDFLDQPSAGYVPVLEVSGRRDGTTDRYIVTAPAGHAILDDYLASLRPVTPVDEVVREVEEVEEPFQRIGDSEIGLSIIDSLTPAQLEYYSKYDEIGGNVLQEKWIENWAIDIFPESRIEVITDILGAIKNIQRGSPTQSIRLSLMNLMVKMADNIDTSVGNLRVLHFARNINQPAQIEYSEVVTGSGWKPARDTEKAFHVNEHPERLVEKWVNQDGREYVFVGGSRDGSGKLLVSGGADGGSFNYAPPEKALAHTMLDIIPWLLWGNTPEDRTKFEDRLRLVKTGSLKIAEEKAERILNSIQGEDLRTGLPLSILRQPPL